MPRRLRLRMWPSRLLATPPPHRSAPESCSCKGVRLRSTPSQVSQQTASSTPAPGPAQHSSSRIRLHVPCATPPPLSQPAHTPEQRDPGWGWGHTGHLGSTSGGVVGISLCPQPWLSREGLTCPRGSELPVPRVWGESVLLPHTQHSLCGRRDVKHRGLFPRHGFLGRPGLPAVLALCSPTSPHVSSGEIFSSQ